MIRQTNPVGVARQAPADTAAVRPAGAPDFRALLHGVLRQPGAPDRADAVKLSSHARERLRQRNIVLGDADMQRISAAASRVASKGGRDALVLMDEVGLILDVANRTVVTAIEREKLQENVFTNIDSAVFA